MDQQKNKNSGNSYSQIVRSTGIIGGSSVINIFLRIVRMKFLAVLLEPAGIGLFGLYDSIVSIAGTVSGLGIQTSGVRQTAEAAATNDQKKISQTIIALRRASFFLGIFGMVLLVLLSTRISRLTFGTSEYASEVALLSVTLLFGAVSGGQAALIQGMRHIGDLAKLSILSSLFGTVFSIPIIYVWGQKGIVPSLIMVAAMGIAASWWYAKKIKIVPVRMEWADLWVEIGTLLKVGVVFMATGVMTTASMYIVRILVVRQLGLDATGLYQAAVTLSILYVGFILEAMGKDYYPRLTAIAQDNAACNQLVNEQTHVGLLLAVPGILATLTLAPVIINVFYSTKFIVACEILRWQLLGIFLRVATWPMGFALIAKGKMKLVFWTELASSALLIGLTWLGIVYFGLPGTGMAFFGMYLLYWILIFSIVRYVAGFTWSATNVRLGLLSTSAVMIVFLAQFVLPDFWYMIVGGAVTLSFGYYSIRYLFKIVDLDGISPVFSKIIRRFDIVLR